jgi:imidazolonepropionase-like amidohydrolase
VTRSSTQVRSVTFAAMKNTAGLLAFALAFLLHPGAVAAQADSAASSGAWIIHKIGNPIGREEWREVTVGDIRRLSSRFAFTDRGTEVALDAVLERRRDGTPARFTLSGRTSRSSTVDLSVIVRGDSAVVSLDGREEHVALGGALLAHGYAPIAVQQALVQDWLARDSPASLSLLPTATVRIAYRGRDTVETTHGPMRLRRLSVAGLIWGRETLWLDERNAIAAAVTVDAEFDPIQAVREDLLPSLPVFVRRAGEDAITALGELDARVPVRADSLIALVGGRLLDGGGGPVIADAVVVISGGRIVAAGPRRTTAIPRGARVVQARGATILPGLWDMHAHFAQAEWGPIYLAAGVTTVRDVGNQLEFLLGVRDAIREGRGLGPRILAAGIIDGRGPRAIGLAQAGTPDEGVAWVRRYHDAGLEQIKVYSSVPPGVLPAITAEAHRLGLTVTGHVPNGMDGYQAVAAGMDQINHVSYIRRMIRAPGDSQPIGPDAPSVRRAVAFLREHHVVVDPTLALYELGTHAASRPVAEFEPGAPRVAPELRTALLGTGVPPRDTAAARARFAEVLMIVGALHRGGVQIVAGTDQAVPGHSLHRELELYVQAGMTPAEAIATATSGAARALGLERESGMLRPGMRGDVLVVDGDPLADIRALRRVRLVIANGRVLDPAPLWRSAGFEP